MKKVAIFIYLLLFLSLACSVLDGYTEPTTVPIIEDSYFSGTAYVDANGNGKIDPDDLPLEGAFFTAVDALGASAEGETNGDGYAVAWWPSKSEYPVTIQMEPPEGSGYTIIGPEEIVLQEWDNHGDFLFKPPDS